MSWEAFSQAMLLLIFASFLVERSLAVLYESDLYIKRYGASTFLKPVIAVLYSTAFVATVDINLMTLVNPMPDAEYGFDWVNRSNWEWARNVLIILLTAVFVAGGSKASLKLFKDVMNIKSAAEARREQGAVSVPANPAKSSVEAAKGNNSARQLSYEMLDNYKSLTG